MHKCKSPLENFHMVSTLVLWRLGYDKIQVLDLKFYRYSFPIITNNEVRADCISHLSAAVARRDKKEKLYDSNKTFSVTLGLELKPEPKKLKYFSPPLKKKISIDFPICT